MLITLLYYMSDLNVNEKDNELTSSCSVCCQYLLRLVHLIKKSRWVHIEYTQHYIDWSLYESKTMWLKSSLHIVSLYIYCLKKCNFKSSLHMISLHKYCLKTQSQKLITHNQPSLHRSDSLSLQTWLWKLITHNQHS